MDGRHIEHNEEALYAAGSIVGQWIPDERRVDWLWHLDPVLQSRVDGERKRYDGLTAELSRPPPRHEVSDDPTASLDCSPTSSASLRRLFRNRHFALSANATVLELGGSGEATRALLSLGASQIHHVDVSPGMQQLALGRLNAEERSRVLFHTTPGEQLPFRNDLFDLVFARHTVHHMRRPDVFHEVCRVLKPTGHFLMIEPRLHDALHGMMRLQRTLLRRDRGTDNPLRDHELKILDTLFDEVDVEYDRGLLPRHLAEAWWRWEQKHGPYVCGVRIWPKRLSSRVLVLGTRPTGK